MNYQEMRELGIPFGVTKSAYVQPPDSSGHLKTRGAQQSCGEIVLRVGELTTATLLQPPKDKLCPDEELRLFKEQLGRMGLENTHLRLENTELKGKVAEQAALIEAQQKMISALFTSQMQTVIQTIFHELSTYPEMLKRVQKELALDGEITPHTLISKLEERLKANSTPLDASMIFKPAELAAMSKSGGIDLTDAEHGWVWIELDLHKVDEATKTLKKLMALSKVMEQTDADLNLDTLAAEVSKITGQSETELKQLDSNGKSVLWAIFTGSLSVTAKAALLLSPHIIPTMTFGGVAFLCLDAWAKQSLGPLLNLVTTVITKLL